MEAAVEISYTAPLRGAWQRMQAMLFRPFHIERWLVVGFAAFLANMFNSGGGLFSWNKGFGSHHDTLPQVGDQLQGLRDHVLTLLEKPLVLLVIAIGLVVFGIMLLVFAWASARAQFVFLDNVATGRGEFVAPWRRYGRLGRSLFLWYAAFSFAWLLPIGVAAYPFGNALAGVLRGEGWVSPPLAVMILGGAAAAVLVLLLTFVSFLMRQFVVPLMFRHGENATQAWARFGPLLSAHPGEFVAYALFVMVVWLGVAVAVLVAGVVTCCIGLALMLVPYVGTVLLLPIEITARAYGPTFLAQFGPEWDVFAAHAPRTDEPVAPLLG